MATFELFASTLRQAGLDAEVYRRFFAEDEGGGDALVELLKGSDELDVLSGSLELDFEDR